MGDFTALKTRVAIVGGGLSGLYAARLLAARGVDFQLVEARDRLGGRILSVGATGGTGGFDLGPSWFWPALQPMIAGLVAESGLTGFAQPDAGAMLVERSAQAPAQRVAGFQQVPQSFRVTGGTGAIVAALAAGLDPDRLHLDTQVLRATLREGDVLLETRVGRPIAAERVLFALPPRLLDRTIGFDPPVALALRARWQATPTWMAPHAKFLAVYDRPFWRDRGLSGAAQSQVGPMVEIHDASAMGGEAALFGFLGVPAAARRQLGDALLDACVAQLARLFGPPAADPLARLFKDWSADALTATDADGDAAAGHPVAAALPWSDPAWAGRIRLVGSETAAGHPGYLEGALEAAAQAVATLEGL